ncbi:MAG: CinA family protein [Segetibacter sp.]|nr:CinA family protein [Segetibacter sp.]
MVYNEDLINKVRDILIEQQETIAVAESVTAGHLQSALSAGMDASKYFQGGITVYNLGQKTRHLHVQPILAEKTNCIHQKIADTMALEVSKMFISEFGMGVTGYASIVPECEDEGLFAYFSIAHNNKIVASGKLTSVSKFPHDVQVDYTNMLLKNLLSYLQKV